MKRKIIALSLLLTMGTCSVFAQLIQSGTLITEKKPLAERPIGWNGNAGISCGYEMEWLDYYVQAHVGYGYNLSPIFYLGLTTGFSYNLGNYFASLPLCINPRLYFSKKIRAPYLDMELGYDFAIKKYDDNDDIYFKEGFHFSASLGYSISEHFDIALGGCLGSLRHEYYYYNYRESSAEIFLKLGYRF